MVIRPYVVRTSSAKMPVKVRSPYRNIAVCETIDGEVPAAIWERGNVVRIVRRWDKLNVGLKIKSAYKFALDDAEAMAKSLNSDHWGCPI